MSLKGVQYQWGCPISTRAEFPVLGIRLLRVKSLNGGFLNTGGAPEFQLGLHLSINK